MKRNETTKDTMVKLTTALLVWAIILAVLIFPYDTKKSSARGSARDFLF
jgi:hypothetical protein